jgi:hypothetical protein
MDKQVRLDGTLRVPLKIKIEGTSDIPQEITVTHIWNIDEIKDFIEKNDFDAVKIDAQYKTIGECNAFATGIILARHICALTAMSETKGIESGMKLAKKLTTFEELINK